MSVRALPDDEGKPGFEQMEARIALIRFLEKCTTCKTVAEINVAAGVVLNVLLGLDVMR